jgi:hypothetical protein
MPRPAPRVAPATSATLPSSRPTVSAGAVPVDIPTRYRPAGRTDLRPCVLPGIDDSFSATRRSDRGRCLRSGLRCARRGLVPGAQRRARVPRPRERSRAAVLPRGGRREAAAAARAGAPGRARVLAVRPPDRLRRRRCDLGDAGRRLGPAPPDAARPTRPQPGVVAGRRLDRLRRRTPWAARPLPDLARRSPAAADHVRRPRRRRPGVVVARQDRLRPSDRARRRRHLHRRAKGRTCDPDHARPRRRCGTGVVATGQADRVHAAREHATQGHATQGHATQGRPTHEGAPASAALRHARRRRSAAAAHGRTAQRDRGGVVARRPADRVRGRSTGRARCTFYASGGAWCVASRRGPPTCGR